MVAPGGTTRQRFSRSSPRLSHRHPTPLLDVFSCVCSTPQGIASASADGNMVCWTSRHRYGVHQVTRQLGEARDGTTWVTRDVDRVPVFEQWLDRKRADLAPGIRRDTEAWLRLLHNGGPRSRPRHHHGLGLPQRDTAQTVQVEALGVQVVAQQPEQLLHRPRDPVRLVDHQRVTTSLRGWARSAEIQSHSADRTGRTHGVDELVPASTVAACFGLLSRRPDTPAASRPRPAPAPAARPAPAIHQCARHYARQVDELSDATSGVRARYGE